ncbi:hypothetical protein GALMADRAFT_146462 [Galerina marginata CBS 339.88]|uniref:pyranose dehydrogenase (acceptor) n=1 Tax=Galerina marginata (strain CBS 339.88) TaxID=685588 RepID=A0A067SBH4_GALM3|nr:hypothetical protein GALMADRAFT_146462 [Galerina marginata CBS 339.88]
MVCVHRPLLSATFFFAICTARILPAPAEAENSDYDFIVIGGGTAGSVIATRLTENPAVRVLVIEAGLSNTGGGSDTPIIQVPFLVSETLNSIFDWNYTTTPQAELNNRSLTYPRGFVLGGSSSINFMAYTRGSSDEYDRLARVSGDPGWGWSHIFKYALKSERHVASADGHNTTGQFDPSLHGTSGPLLTSLPGFPAGTDQFVLNATSQLSEFPFKLDANGGNPIGISWLHSTIGSSARSSGATAYLMPNMERDNLDILVNTYATRLLPTGHSSAGKPTFRTVEFAQGPGEATKKITARKEVILSAGSIGTPQLLLLSGIGEKASVEKLGIKSAVNLPDVGRNLQDHPFLTIPFAVNSTQTFDTVVFNQKLFNEDLQLYNQNKTGIFANNAIANQIGFFRLPKTSSILGTHKDPSAGPNSPHYEFAFSNGFVATTQNSPTTGNFFSLTIILLTPTSRGSLTIQSSSVFDHPSINPNYLFSKPDMDIFVEAIKAGKRFLTAPAWKGYLGTPFQDAANLTSESDIQNYIRSKAISLRHPVSTAAMSKYSDKGGVVGPDLLVKGVDGLRVVDASVLPFALASHPQAAIYIIAERAADIIKSTHKLGA